jgi:hypothetical protein
MLEISRLSEQLLASQQTFYSVEISQLIGYLVSRFISFTFS